MKNPPAGAVLSAPAGGRATAEFEFVNDSPDVAVFDLVVEGLPDPGWLDLTNGRYSAAAAASGVGSLLLALAPPANTTVGDYSFTVSIVSGGVAVGQGRIGLVLRVEPAPVARPASKPARPKVEEDLEEAPQEIERHSQGDGEQAAPKPKRPAARKPRAEPPDVVLRAGDRTPPAKAVPDPAPPAVQADEEEDLPVVDYSRHEREEEDETPEQEEPIIAEKSVVDPIEGSIFSLCPGETLLVRFSFVNESAGERTYILDEDRSLENGWITLVQDQVNLTRNGRGEVSLRLTPPRDAEPGEYPFTVTTGLQGGILTSVSFTLAVQAMPAVKLTAKQAVVSIGPFSTFADFPLVVESAGNADTAFRVGVRNPDAGKESGETHTPDTIYETRDWRYLFDREMEDLRSPSPGRPPQPTPIRLRMVRRGPWWFGFRESHSVRVAAVPVTEPANNGKTGNTVQVSVRRWRFLPVPLAVFIPIVLVLLVFFAQGARQFSVVDTYQDPQGQYWAVDPAGDHKNITLAWQALPWTFLRLTAKTGNQVTFGKTLAGSGSLSQTVPVTSQDRRVISVYHLSRLMGGGGRDATVSFIYTSSNTPLIYFDGNTHRPLAGTNLTVAVPATGYARLDLKNASPQFNRVDWWIANTLDEGGSFRFLYNKDSGSIEPGESEHFLILRNSSAQPGATDQIVFVTTDATRPIVTVTLVARP